MRKKTVIKNIFSLSIIQIFSYIIPALTFPYLVRIFGIEKYGVLAFVSAIMFYVRMVVEYGFNLSATKEVAHHRSDKSALERIVGGVFAARLILFAALGVLLYVAAELFGVSALYKKLFFYFYIGIFFQIFLAQWYYMGLERMEFVALLSFVAKLLFAVGIFLYVRSEEDLYLVPMFDALGTAVSAALSLVILYSYFSLRPKPSLSLGINYLKTGWSVFVSVLFMGFYRHLYTVIVGMLGTEADVGRYAVAERIVKLIQSGQNVVGNAFFPRLAKRFDENIEAFFAFSRKYLWKIALVYGIVALLVGVFADEIIRIVKGGYDEATARNLKILAIVVFVGGLNYVLGIIGLIALGYKRSFMQMVVATGLFSIVATLILVYLLRDLGATLAFVASETLLLLLLVRFFIRSRHG